MNYYPMSPCSVNSIQNWTSEQDVKRKIYNRLRDECVNKYQSSVAPALEAFAQCHAKAGKFKNRPKRLVDPITITALIIGMITVVGWLETMLWNVIDPNSPGNRLDRMEERERKRVTKRLPT